MWRGAVRGLFAVAMKTAAAFVPAAEEIYPPDDDTRVVPGKI